MLGKRIRMDRIMNRETKRTVIVPMDHGISMGPIEGLVNMPDMLNKVVEGGANAIVLHKGIVKLGYRGYGKDVGLIIHLSASTSLGPDANDKRIVSSVQHAIKLGADAISIHVNVGAETEPRMLEEMGRISEECEEWGMPLLAMMYPRGKNVQSDEKTIAHVARVGAELGADIIKTVYTGEKASFKRVIEGAGVPIVIAGGPKMNTEREVLQMVADSLDAGAVGVSLGRNVFQARDPVKMVRALAAVVHENKDVNEALAELR